MLLSHFDYQPVLKHCCYQKSILCQGFQDKCIRWGYAKEPFSAPASFYEWKLFLITVEIVDTELVLMIDLNIVVFM